MIGSRCFRPGDGKQKRALFQCFNIVFKSALNSEEVSRNKFLHPIFRKMYPDLPQYCLHGDRTFSAVVAHIASQLHPYKDDAKLWILYDGLRTPAGFALPGLGILQFFQLVLDVLSDDLVCEFRQASHALAVIGCVTILFKSAH